MVMALLTLFQDKLALSCNYNEKELAKEISDYIWNKKNKFWLYPCTQSKLLKIKKFFPNIYIEPIAKKRVEELEEIKQRALLIKTLDDYDINCDFLKTEPYNFQKAGIAFMLNQDSTMLFDEMGPLSCDTEYLSPDGWRRMDQYDGGLVCQVTPKGKGSFVKPIRYIKKPCKHMLLFSNKEGLSFLCSYDHRVLYYNIDGDWYVEKAVNVFNKFLSNRLSNFYFKCSFKVNNTKYSYSNYSKVTGISSDYSPDKYQYCFTLPSTFFPTRRNGHIVLTGNCGKTLQSIATAIIRKQKGEIKRALIVCPVSMKHVWKQEIEKHSYEKGMVVEGNKKKRLEIYEEFKKSNYLFLIVNYEIIRCDINIFENMYEKN